MSLSFIIVNVNIVILLQVTEFPAQTKHGLKNMIGNVWEWVSDWWQINHFTQPLSNPVWSNLILHLIFEIMAVIGPVQFYNFWQTYTGIDSQQNNAYTLHSTYCTFLHYLVEIILSVFCAVSIWNLLVNYVGRQLNSVNHTKFYWSVYRSAKN